MWVMVNPGHYKEKIAILVLLAVGLVPLLGVTAFVSLLVTGLALVIIAFVYFHRDPEREILSAPNSILSAADGKVWAIRKIRREDLCKEPGIADLDESVVTAAWGETSDFWSVSVLMSVVDVHVNRAPIAGRVVSKAPRHGELGLLKKDERSRYLRAERNTILIQDKGISVAVVQIASHLVRKIECWVSCDDFVKQGQRIGWIRMGSLVDMVFPAHESDVVHVREGDKVKAGMSAIATMNHPDFAAKDAVVVGQLKRSDTEEILRIYLRWSMYGYLYAKLTLLNLIRWITSARKHKRD